MIKIAVYGQGVTIASEMEDLLLKIAGEKNIPVDIDVFIDGKELTGIVCSGEKFHLIYLNIEMENENGVNLARSIREADDNALILYVSGYDGCIRRLFEINIFRFIDKPLDMELFERYFLEACRETVKNVACFTYRFNREVYNILLEDIIYFESQGRKIMIHQLEGRKGAFIGKLNEVEKNLEESAHPFLRIHQSYLVNFIYIKSMANTYIRLEDYKELPISESRQKEVMDKYYLLLRRNI